MFKCLDAGIDMNVVSINSLRISMLSSIFRSFGREKILIFEDIDPQFISIKNLVQRCSGYTQLLVVLNALVSYRLVMSGEEYWEKFSHYFADKCGEALSSPEHLFKDFIERFNKVLVGQKFSRILRAIRCRELLNTIYRGSLVDAWKAIGKCLNSELDAKTVVFAVKMLYYARKALGEVIEIPMDIPIPVDGRVAMITYYSGLLEIDAHRVSREVLMRYADTIRFIWSNVAKLSSVPPLNLDSVIWFFGKYTSLPSRREVLQKAVKDLGNTLSEEDIKILTDNLFYRLPEH
uniref:N-glycosylase/DNA lyase n=1 Tax=Ignisphaera aggregans TaxID=334771 RepID=A0A7J2U5Z6_9CREN